MAKKANKPQRLEQGETVYFISYLTYKVVATHDCYFPTDDERFQSGNYFPDATACHACSEEIIDTYVPKLDILKKLQKENLDKYIKATKEVAEKCKSLMGSYIKAKEGEEDKPKRAKKEQPKPDFEPQVLALVDAYTAYKSRHDELNKDTADVKKDIEDFIKRYPK